MQRAGQTDLRAIALLIVSGLGLVSSLSLAAILLLVGLIGLLGQAVPLDELVAIFALGWIAVFLGLLALPSIIFSTLRLLGREWRLPTLGGGFRLASLLIMLWPLVLAAGSAVARYEEVAWLLLPPLHLLSVALPVWWLVELARRGLPGGSPQRGWGILSTSLFVTTPFVVVVELIGLILLIVVVIVAVSMVPGWVEAIEQLAQRMAMLENNPQAAEQIIQSYLDSPPAVFATLGILAVIVPLLEEFLKPLAVWFLVGRRITAAEGFAAGAICGGAFALLESLMTLSGTENEGWAGLMVARAGTGLLHIATTALVGSALALAIGKRDYLRLALAYLAAATWHGLWNGLSIIFSVGSMQSSPPPELTWLARLAPAAPLALLALVAILFVFLWGSNRRLRSEI